MYRASNTVLLAKSRLHCVVIAFASENYGIIYAENSRETIRKQAIHHFRNAAFIEDNRKETSSPNYRYRLTDEMLVLIHSYGSAKWSRNLAAFQKTHSSLVELYVSKRTMRKMPVKINGKILPSFPASITNCKRLLLRNLHHALHLIPSAFMLMILRKRLSWSVISKPRLRSFSTSLTKSALPDLLSWPQKFITVQMNHVIGHIRNPYLCFPRKRIRKLLERLKIQESSNIDFSGSNTGSISSISLIRFGSIGPTEVTDLQPVLIFGNKPLSQLIFYEQDFNNCVYRDYGTLENQCVYSTQMEQYRLFRTQCVAG